MRWIAAFLGFAGLVIATPKASQALDQPSATQAPQSTAVSPPLAAPDPEKKLTGSDTSAPATTSKAAQQPRAEAPGSVKKSSEKDKTEAGAARVASPLAVDVVAARADVAERLKALTPAAGKAETGASKPLREVLEDRLRWLDQFDADSKALAEWLHPAQTPEQEGHQLKAELERLRSTLDQAVKDPLSLLPDAFRVRADHLAPGTLTEMKDAIEAAKGELNQARDAIDKHAETTKKSASALTSLRTERDKVHQACAALPARRAERVAAVSAASTSEARELAREKLANFEWEARALELQLQSREAQIKLETKRASLAEVETQLLEARHELAKRTLEAMQSRYSALVERQQRDLKQAAAHEEVRAASSLDPLEKYKARRTAELLVLKAQVLKDEHALSAGTTLSLEEQRELADRAQRDYQGVKQLVDEGRSSAIVALRLRNDYRLLSLARATVIRTELARSNDDMTRFENALTAVELDLVNETREERYSLDSLLELLPTQRRIEAKLVSEQLDMEHRALLIRRRMALEKLADRAQEVHKQVQRRLQILDDQYAFVRTHIFWMRDAEPLGLPTLVQVPREFRSVVRAFVQIACEACDRAAWTRVSPVFTLTLLTCLALPWPVYRSRVILNARLVPAPQTED